MRPIGRPAPAFSIASSALARPESAADWSASPPSPIHSSDFVGPGQIGVDEHAVGRAAVRPQPRQRELRRLRDGVLRHVRRRPLAGGAGDVHDAAPAALAHAGHERAHRAQRRHHVQLPRRLPVLVGHVVEVAPARGAGVVDQHVRLARRARGPRPASARPHPDRSRRSAAPRRCRPPRGRPPAPAASAAAERATSSTEAPSAHSARAVARPMPRLAPVTTHARPFRPRSTRGSLGRGPQSARAEPRRAGRKTRRPASCC